jgi:hypothetical protein
MEVTDLEAMANYLYGGRWETSLARLLIVSTGDIRDWRAGQPMPPEHEAALIDRVAARQLQQAWPAIKGQIAAYGKPAGIDRKVYREGSNVLTSHKRPWSHETDLLVEQRLAALLEDRASPPRSK